MCKCRIVHLVMLQLFFDKNVKYILNIRKKIYWVRFDQKVGYILVDWVRFDQKSGYVLTKTGYVLVGYVLAWVRFDHKPPPNPPPPPHDPSDTATYF